ncbi:carbonate dehydratase, eukaryotic-type [Ancylostoma ceylanicum]|uniref:Carbonic anhydrase n=1 Tax=Ancylostoma ceylanicum TaxID=53326 RepID=A0A0D6MDC3_9BILA|nr:carbonate dehydratase, eukaryotic-type [Ancylostoma ceylanicum]
MRIGTRAGEGGHWGYPDNNGDNWPKLCKVGLRQSPIDIRAPDVEYVLLDRMEFVHYDHIGPANISNNGHTIEADGFENWGEKQPYIQGAGLKYRYRLVQVHFHWAQYDHLGSEHKIGGLHYPAELHLVHVRNDLTLSEAVRKIDGIAVVGVFLMIEDNGSSTAAFSSVIENIIFPVRGFRTRPLLPKHTEAFYRYEGSLTTPGCYEAVTWTVLAEPITINGTQIEQLRQVQFQNGGKYRHNYRSTKPLHGRRILYRPNSFNKKLLCGGLQTTSIFAALLVIILAYFL